MHNTINLFILQSKRSKREKDYIRKNKRGKNLNILTMKKLLNTILLAAIAVSICLAYG